MDEPRFGTDDKEKDLDDGGDKTVGADVSAPYIMSLEPTTLPLQSAVGSKIL